jgi:predicted DsbA family dithiol-disulfide isomerase
MQVTCFFDYACSYSYKLFRWLRVVQRENPELRVDWRTFSVKAVNEDGDSASTLRPSSLSSTALALAHAARDADFSFYHAKVFQAMHEGAPIDQEVLYRIAADAGVDVQRFARDERRWLLSVAEEHDDAERRYNVFGTPTLVLNGQSVFLKLNKAPDPGEELHVWESLCCVATCYPEVLEIKRPPG